MLCGVRQQEAAPDLSQELPEGTELHALTQAIHQVAPLEVGEAGGELAVSEGHVEVNPLSGGVGEDAGGAATVYVTGPQEEGVFTQEQGPCELAPF